MSSSSSSHNQIVAGPSNQTPGVAKKPPRPKQFECGFSGCRFKSFRHRTLQVHISENHCCCWCGRVYRRLQSHVCPKKGQLGGSVNQIDESFFKEFTRAYGNVIVGYNHIPKRRFCIVADFFEHVEDPLHTLLEELIGFYHGIQVIFKLVVHMREMTEVVKERPNNYIGTHFMTLTHPNFIDNIIYNGASYIISTLNVYADRGSAWSIVRIRELQILVGRYSPIAPRSYMPIPSELSSRKSLLNLRPIGDLDSKCFFYSVAAGIYSGQVLKEHFERAYSKNSFPKSTRTKDRFTKEILGNANNFQKYIGTKDFNINDILITPTKGVTLLDIDTFEKNNPKISVSVYGNVGKDIIVVRRTPQTKENHVDLLLVESTTSSHYILIKNLSRFLGKDGIPSHIFCPKCSAPFRQQRVMDTHILRGCVTFGSQPAQAKSESIKFQNLGMTLRLPWALYYSFKGSRVCIDNSGNPKTSRSSIEQESLQAPLAYAICLIGPDGMSNCESYDNKYPVKHFLTRVLKIAYNVLEHIKTTNKPVTITSAERIEFDSATVCKICEQPFTDKNYKVLHHNHQTSLYVGALCNACNLCVVYPRFLPVICSDGQKVDHHIISHGFLSNQIRSVRPFTNSSNGFMGFIVNNIIRFISAGEFTMTKSDDMIKMLRDENDLSKFSFLKNYFCRFKSGFPLLLERQIFPFTIPQNREEYIGLKELPAASSFYDSVTEKSVTQKELDFANKVFTTFKCESFSDYVRVQAKTSAILLACYFEDFRNRGIDAHGLDPLHNFSLSRYSWECMLYKTKSELFYLPTVEMKDFCNRGIRGGITFVNSRKVESNTERLDNFDPDKPRTEILYCDLISSYAFCMMQNLPWKDFEFMSRSELDSFDYNGITVDQGVGYIFEVDLDYPDYLHDTHKFFPLAPDKTIISLEQMSPIQKQYVQQHSELKKVSRECELLILSLYGRKNYVTYYKNLKYYLSKGLILKKIHNGLKFKESKLFKSYMVSNSERRKDAQSSIIEMLLKLSNNVIAGRLLLQPSKYDKIKFCFNGVDAVKYLAMGRVRDVQILDGNLTAFSLSSSTNDLDTFRHIGFVVLELSKLVLYKRYDTLRNVFQNSMELFFCHTDSLMAKVVDPERKYIDRMKQLAFHFDFSKLPISHPLYSTINKGVPGKLSVVSDSIEEFLGVRLSQYSLKFKSQDGSNTFKTKASGIPKHVIDTLCHEHYRRVIENTGRVDRILVKSVRVMNNNIFTIQMSRIAFQGLDLKSYMISNTCSIPYGYYSLRENFAKADEENKDM